jgi:hypothetical protein
MEGTEKPHMDKHKEITSDWNYDASCTLTSLLVWDLENFKCLIFVAQSVLTVLLFSHSLIYTIIVALVVLGVCTDDNRRFNLFCG